MVCLLVFFLQSWIDLIKNSMEYFDRTARICIFINACCCCLLQYYNFCGYFFFFFCNYYCTTRSTFLPFLVLLSSLLLSYSLSAKNKKVKPIWLGNKGLCCSNVLDIIQSFISRISHTTILGLTMVLSISNVRFFLQFPYQIFLNINIYTV